MTDILRITAICASLLLLMSCQERVDHNPAATSSEPEVFVGYEGITNRLILRNGLFYKPFETEPFSGRYEDRTDGYLAWEQTYEKGVPIGVRYSWYKNGQIKSETAIGISYRGFDEDGALTQQADLTGDYWLYTFYYKGQATGMACKLPGLNEKVSLELCGVTPPQNGPATPIQ